MLYDDKVPGHWVRVPLKHGQVMFGDSDGNETPMQWFVWPAAIDSMQAIISEALFGPYEDEETAQEAAESIELFEEPPQ